MLNYLCLVSSKFCSLIFINVFQCLNVLVTSWQMGRWVQWYRKFRGRLLEEPWEGMGIKVCALSCMFTKDRTYSVRVQNECKDIFVLVYESLSYNSPHLILVYKNFGSQYCNEAFVVTSVVANGILSVIES